MPHWPTGIHHTHLSQFDLNFLFLFLTRYKTKNKRRIFLLLLRAVQLSSSSGCHIWSSFSLSIRSSSSSAMSSSSYSSSSPLSSSSPPSISWLHTSWMTPLPPSNVITIVVLPSSAVLPSSSSVPSAQDWSLSTVSSGKLGVGYSASVYKYFRGNRSQNSTTIPLFFSSFFSTEKQHQQNWQLAKSHFQHLRYDIIHMNYKERQNMI